ncbi:sensor domain-containing protein [Undibacterium fentianense]|uniref:EAL domain-containing protein n=1 Tax=Undibacterium fentianense TaxID=2828728 RepID=A0A941ICX6_9BURK|nr:bifunctional diguanylate cyclase/phosphodiesterase [Undibacterium fentianense]MBR7800689.1 EAL domain-containing protein [Undibacterium fentianense]
MIKGQWEALIEGMIEGVLLVDPLQLQILAANRSAHKLLGVPANSLIGVPVVDLASSPEDMFFWEDVAAGLSNNIYSETLLKRADDSIVQVVRRVSLVHLDLETTLYVVAIRDHTDQRQVETELEKLIAELRATLESTADGILVTDLDGSIRSYNRLFAKLWNLPEELLTQRQDDAIYAWMDQCMVDASHYNERLASIKRSPLMEATDILVLHSGRVLERVTLPQYARGRPIGRVYSFRDISEKLADQARIQLASKVFEASTDAIFITDQEQKIITINPSFERLTLFTENEVVGLNIADFLLNQSNAELLKRLIEGLAEQGFWEGEIWNRRKDGHAYLCMISLVQVQNADGEVMHTIGFFKDRTESYNAKQKIEELAFSDALTGLPNRLLLEERINQSITHASRDNGEFALLFLDLDNFKHINDSLGHPFGDRVLIEVTERLKNCLRQVDTAARLGGDEFVLLLHQANASGAEICARRVLADLSAPFCLDGIPFSVTCSIGIALYPADGQSIQDLIKNADSAMYYVKERGRSDFRFYQKQMNIGLLSRMKIDHAMRQALEHQEFRLHYQPLVDLSTNQVFGAEALLRWYDKDLGEVSPAKFIPIAEETGLIIAIGNWVMHTAIAQAAAWNKEGRHLRISINVSALQFQQANFVDTLANALDDAHLDPNCIDIELTESILIRDVEETLKKLHAIAKLGVRMSIDDFGTGYSSLSYLKRFPIHKLKIDRSFIMNLTKDESDIAIVTAIISLAHALKLTVIAEGVETDEQKELLSELNCNEIQGFLVAKALDPHAFEAQFLQVATPLEQLPNKTLLGR